MGTRLRVLQVVTRRQRRGAEVFAAQLADILVERGHESRVLGLYQPEESPPETHRAESLDLGGLDKSRLSVRSVLRLARATRSYAPDLVQANGSDTLKYCVLARWVGGRRWPLVYRNISVASRWLRGRGHRALNGCLARRVDHVVAVSEFSARDFARTYAIERGRISVIPQSASVPDALASEPARRTLEGLTGVPSGTPLVMHAGSFSVEKNHLWLVDAFCRIRERHPSASLILVGDGPLRAEVEEHVRDLDLMTSVHFLGWRSDASELMAGADVLVLPSTVEGLPGVVLEAAAQGVPAVANDVGGVREAVRDGETGVVVTPGDVHGFVSAVGSLIGDPARRRQMGARARALVKAQFDFEDIATQYERLYDRLVRERR